MGDAVEITHGGIIAVDPEALRGWRDRVRGTVSVVQEARADLLAIPAIAQQAGVAAVPAVWSAARGIDQVCADLDALAVAVGGMADVFELAELRAQQAILRVQDPVLAKADQRRIDELLAAHPGLAERERRMQQEWRDTVTAGFTPEGAKPWWADGPGMAALSLASPAAFIAISAVRAYERFLVGAAEGMMAGTASTQGVKTPTMLAPRPGAVVIAGSAGAAGAAGSMSRPGDVLLRAGGAAALRPGAGTPGSAPATLGQAVARMPSGTAAQVRVENYTLADGSSRFIAYVDGTRSNRVDGSGTEPWDMTSNGQTYLQHAESDAYKATVAALKDAGADASTPVDLVGYSQGGMIADLIAQSGDFAVQGVFTVGSPIEPQLPSGVLDVAVRHTDDPVAGLAGGGAPGGTGSPDSLVIMRTVAPGHGVDPAIPAHLLGGYRDTIRLAEESGDVRMQAIQDHFAALDGATMTATDYTASRVGGK